MGHPPTNGNGGVVILPPPTKAIGGRGLARRKLDQRQKACAIVGVLDGVIPFAPSQKQLADLFHVSVVYVELARRLSAEKRAAILSGKDKTSFADLMTRPHQLVLPAITELPDSVVERLVRSIGTDRLLTIACAVESTT